MLEEGGVVALPTETLYGLAADALRAESLARVNRLKRKPEDSAVLLLLASAEQVSAVAVGLPELYGKLTERFWPGPLTLVVPARPGLPPQISHGGTVAVRVPGLPLPRRLAARLGRPISGVSANRSGQPPCRRAREVAAALGDEVDLILDGGETPSGAPSTILDLSADRPKLLREGVLPRSALEPFLPDSTLY